MARSVPVLDISAQLQLDNRTDPELLDMHAEVNNGSASIEFNVAKYAHLGALPTQFNAVKVAHLFTEMVIKLHGLPKSIVSDRDPIFTSKFWTELFRLSGTSLNLSSAYHPQSDGQSEVLNRCVEQYLRAFSQDNPRNWHKHLLWAEYSYNTSFHSTIQMTPFEAVYGKAPPTLNTYIPGTTSVEAVDTELQHRDEILNRLRANLTQAKSRMKDRVDHKRVDKHFDIGSLSATLEADRTAAVGFGVDSCGHSKKIFTGVIEVKETGTVASGADMEVTHTGTVNLALSSGTQVILQNDKPVTQLRVQWHGLLPEDASWENLATLQTEYPHLNLEGKVPFQAVGNDSNHIDVEPEGAQNAEDIEVGVSDEGQLIPKEQKRDSRVQRVKQKSIWLKDYI
ncbi:uncharacterized protein LOC143883117 [Tasmannia lanceolata]|uniref:uncharacterized protein LOC143883117 n=1 Tax=Tasmannia lanceolata TaxID=3420 RepID=UPI004063A9E8